MKMLSLWPIGGVVATMALFFSLLFLLPLLAGAVPSPAAAANQSLCIAYLDYRNPSNKKLTVLAQENAFNFTQWAQCARKCSDFGADEKLAWDHTCQIGADMDCKITYHVGKLSVGGRCPALYNYNISMGQSQQSEQSGEQIGTANANEMVVHVSGRCLLFADNRTESGFTVVELEPPKLTPQQFGVCAQNCAKFRPNYGSWKFTCHLPSGDQCQIRRDNTKYGMHGICPVMNANGSHHFAQLFTNLMAEKQTSAWSAAVANTLPHTLLLLSLCIAMICRSFGKS